MDLYPTAGSQFSLPVPQSAMKLVCNAFNTLVGQFSFSDTHTNGIKMHFLLAQNIASECQRNKPVSSESDVIFIELRCQLQRVSHQVMNTYSFGSFLNYFLKLSQYLLVRIEDRVFLSFPFFFKVLLPVFFTKQITTLSRETSLRATFFSLFYILTISKFWEKIFKRNFN